MRLLDDGHKYELDHLDGQGKEVLQFANREGGRETVGTTTQEVIRALIDRTWYCNDCLPWHGNAQIVEHLRMALVLHEARAMIRGVVKGEIKPEFVHLGSDAHFELKIDESRASSYARMPDTETDTGGLNEGICSHYERSKQKQKEKNHV